MCFDALLKDAIDPVLKPAGFKRAKRRYTLTAPNGNIIVVDFHAYPLMPGGCSFMIEWGAVPGASVAWYCRDNPRRTASPMWGSIAERMQTPFPMTSFGDDVCDVWAFMRDDGYTACAEALIGELHGTYFELWERLLDSDEILKYAAANRGLRKGLLLSQTPADGDWGYVAVHVDDGDVDELDRILTRLERKERSDSRWAPSVLRWLDWWRQRLEARRPSGDLDPPGTV